MKKIIHVVPNIFAESSGTSYAVPAFCDGLHNAGCELILCTEKPLPEREFAYSVYSYPVRSLPHPRLGRSPEMLEGLVCLCKDADIIHNHSLWMMPNVYADWARRGTASKLVVQPHGTLSKWALSNSRYKKKMFGWLWQNKVLRNVDMWVATADSEYQDIRNLGYRQPVCVLPNGVSVPNVSGSKKLDRRRMFFLSRIHPKKNVEMLIRAWRQLEDKFRDWDLSIIGPDKENSYADQMKSLASALGCSRIRFEGELKGDAKLGFMADSECMVLPTHSENFGLVVAESLSCGVPVICSRGAPWEGLNINGCGWWIPTTENDLIGAMAEAMACSREELAAKGIIGRKWMQRDFSWKTIGEKMRCAYEWLLGQSEKPEYVHVD